MRFVSSLLSLLPSAVAAFRSLFSTPDSRVKAESEREARETRVVSDLSAEEWRRLIEKYKKQ